MPANYKGETVSTIGEEKAFNPRLRVQSVDQYIEIMNNLKLPNPKMMDVAVPANGKIGLSQGEVGRRGWAVTTAEFARAIDRSDTAVVDIREVGGTGGTRHRSRSLACAECLARGNS